MYARGRLRDEELFEIGVEPDGARPRRGRGGGLVTRGLSGVMTAALLVGLVALYAAPPAPDGAAEFAEIRVRPQPVLTAPPPEWRALAAPTIGLGLDAAGFVGLPARHTARAHASGAMEDTLVFGAFAGAGTHLRITLRREGDAPAPARGFFVETALAAAEAGLAVARSGQAEPLATKFGMLDVAQLTLENGPVRACLAFRGGAAPALSGWLCAEPARARDLACLIDGLVLLDDGGDPRLAAAFAATAGRAPSGCAPEAAPARQVVASGDPTATGSTTRTPIPPARPRGGMNPVPYSAASAAGR